MIEPHFERVYAFLGSLFDPTRWNHAELMNSLSPVDKECLRILMHNLAVTLSTQQFHEEYQMLVAQDVTKMNLFSHQASTTAAKQHPYPQQAFAMQQSPQLYYQYPQYQSPQIIVQPTARMPQTAGMQPAYMISMGSYGQQAYPIIAPQHDPHQAAASIEMDPHAHNHHQEELQEQQHDQIAYQTLAHEQHEHEHELHDGTASAAHLQYT
eukprot:GEZU01020100.1.p1 GENE.GEZU01020100.1~~GEZU01020100.1.p1  ORF type:complete len:210 (+),score=38.72 GEZU01020100.1:118-747(+)